MNHSLIIDFEYLKCFVESLALMALWNVLEEHHFSLWRNMLTFSLLIGASIVIACLDSSVLLLSFVLLFMCTYIGFGTVGVQNVFLNSLFALLSLLYLQVFLMWFFPAPFFSSHFGQFCINSSVLGVAIVLYFVSKRLRWAEAYVRNKRTVWIFLLLLSLPSIFLMQIVASNIEGTNRVLMLCLVLLQVVYLLALILSFSIFRRKQEKQQIRNMIGAIDNLNLYMEDSKRRIHDFNKHIHFLRSIVTTRSNDPCLKSSVDEYCKDILSLAEQEEIMLQIEDPVFRALLYRRALQARNCGIDLQLEGTVVLPSFPLRNYQLVEIFDNLVDNAFDCVTMLSENRWIRISLQVMRMSDGKIEHLLCVQNPYEELDFSSVVNLKYYTSKGGDHQGIGLSKVALMVSKTGGKMVLNHDNDIFTVKISYTIRE